MLLVTPIGAHGSMHDQTSRSAEILEGLSVVEKIAVPRCRVPCNVFYCCAEGCLPVIFLTLVGISSLAPV